MYCILNNAIKAKMIAAILVGILFLPGCSGIVNANAPTDSAAAATPTATPEPTPIPTPVPTTEAEPTPTPYPASVSSDSSKVDIKILQQRLLTLGYYLSDETMGIYGGKTAVAVSEFQRQNGLAQTGEANGQTCTLLFSEAASECIAFSELAPTVNMSFEELAGDDGLRDHPAGYPAADTYYIIVDITHQVTMVYTQDENGEYTVPVRYMLCSTGLTNPTPQGIFEMGAYKVRFSRFSRDGRYGQYWSQIFGAYYFHTFLYTHRDAASYDEDTYLELGNKASHGCVRLTVPDARWIWYKHRLRYHTGDTGRRSE